MVDKIKPLKMEDVNDGGDEIDLGPTEVDPSEDYLATKGLAFENSDDYRVEKLERALLEAYPDGSAKVTYTSNNPTLIEFFTTATQITANRIASVEITYSGNNPSTEVLRIYDEADGTTVVRTITKTFTYSSNNLQSYTEVTT